MRKSLLLILMVCLPAAGELRNLGLRQAVEIALRQNPELMMQRLNELRSQESIQLARDPFVPKVFVGSGLAYSNGFPMSIDGAAPSIFQARAVQSIFNRGQSYQVAKAREEARGAAVAVQAERDEVAFRTASLYMEADRAGRSLMAAERQVESLKSVFAAVQQRVDAGRELPIAVERARLNLAKADQYMELLEIQRDNVEATLAVVLGFSPEDRVRPTGEDRSIEAVFPLSPEEAVSAALDNSKEIRRLESSMLAKGFDIRSHKAAWLPQVNLVAQYGMFARFNNYEDFFRTFQRHNGQVGISVQVPVLVGSGPKAAASQAEIELSRLRLEMQSARNRVALEARKSFQEMRQAQTAAEVANLDLKVAREQLSIVLVRLQEGRAALNEVEESRFLENQKWIAYYDAHFVLQQARLNLLRHTGSLLANLQ